MRILIDCRPIQYLAPGDERSRLIAATASELISRNNAEVIYLIDKQGGEPFPGGSYIKQSALPGRAGWKLWYDWNLPRIAKKHKVDWIFTTGGIAASSNLPQVCWIPAVDPKSGSKTQGKQGATFRKLAAGAKGLTGLMERRLDKTLRIARAVMCFTPEDVQKLTSRTKSDNLRLVNPVAGNLTPLSHQDREAAKSRLAAGKEYFFTDITGIPEDDLIQLLKAFSRFKKRQLTNLQLVLGGTPAIPAKQITEKLDSYKYRLDVHWYREYVAGSNPADPGGAYAILRPFTKKEPGLAVVEAWKMEVPVIVPAGNYTSLATNSSTPPAPAPSATSAATSSSNPPASSSGDTPPASTPAGTKSGTTSADTPPAPPALLFAQPGDTGSLAEKLMLIYKDESLRSRLIREGTSITSAPTTPKPAEQLAIILGLQNTDVPAPGLQSVI